MGVGVPAAIELLSVPVVGNAFMAFMTMIGLTIIAGTAVQKCLAWKNELVRIENSNKIPTRILTRGDLMINIIGTFVTFMGAMIFGWIGNLPMTIAMLAGVIYFKR